MKTHSLYSPINQLKQVCSSLHFKRFLQSKILVSTSLLLLLFFASCSSKDTDDRQTKPCVRRYDEKLSRQYSHGKLDTLYDIAKMDFYYASFVLNLRLLVSNDSVVWDTIPYCQLDFCFSQLYKQKSPSGGTLKDDSGLRYYIKPMPYYKYCRYYKTIVEYVTQFDSGEPSKYQLGVPDYDASTVIDFSRIPKPDGIERFMKYVQNDKATNKWLKEHLPTWHRVQNR